MRIQWSHRLGRTWLTVWISCSLCGALIVSAPQLKSQATESLADAIKHLPDCLPDQHHNERNALLLSTLDASSEAQKRAVLPALVQWADDPRPEVRTFSLGLVYLSTLGSSAGLLTQHIARIAPHLVDEDAQVRNAAALALYSAANTEAGRTEVAHTVLPALGDPRVLQQAPDPFFTRARDFELAHTPLDQIESVEHQQQQQELMLLPAVGPLILDLLLRSHAAENVTGRGAILAFLKREDQTSSTLSDCLHLIALVGAPEEVENATVTRVFEKKAMSVFLMSWLNNLQLTPEHREQQKERLVHLASDGSVTPKIRHAASTVAACWLGDMHHLCQPDQADFVVTDEDVSTSQ